jgi:hypothetical protein
MRVLLTILVCFVACGCASNTGSSQNEQVTNYSEALAPRKIPLGKLGRPVGTALTIEGVRQKHGKFAGGFLVVDTVNDQKLAKPVSILIQNSKNLLPADTRCVFEGYETGSMAGEPPALRKGRLESTHQVNWQFWRTFVITSVIEPKSLKIK